MQNSRNHDGLLRAAALQFSPRRGEVPYNLRRMKELADGVDAGLLVLPELASTGYFFTDPDELRSLAEMPESGDFCTWMRELAAGRNMVVIGGFAERTGDGTLYNAALIALPDSSYHFAPGPSICRAASDNGSTKISARPPRSMYWSIA